MPDLRGYGDSGAGPDGLHDTVAGTSWPGPAERPARRALSHGHRGPVPNEPLDRPTRVTLAGEVAQANATVAPLPTMADAEAAGYRKVSPYLPCTAAHYMRTDLLMGDIDAPPDPEADCTRF